jgi:hypothetical protein
VVPTPTVGVDARTLVGKRSGVGNYLTNILQAGAFDGYRLLAYYDAADVESNDDDAESVSNVS